MASSQVEIVSSSPFGCVLRDHNQRDRCRDSSNASRVAFEKNLKELVRDHFNSCVSISSDSASNENSQNQMNTIDSWVNNEHGNNRHLLRSFNHDDNNNNRIKEYDSLAISPRHARILDRWAAKQAQEMVSTIERQSQEAELLPSRTSRENPETSSDVVNLGASSLVQIWEARLNLSNSMNMNLNPSTSSSRTSSSLSYNETASCLEEPSRGSENGDSVDERYDARTNNEDSLMDWESQSDRTALSEPPPSLYGRNSDDVENERVRVADIIRRLTSGSEDNNDHELVNESPRERMHSSALTDQAEQRSISQVVSSPKIRGRQAFADLLMQMERDRHRELDSLVQRQAVSRFAQRGRIQSLLRLRFLQRGMAILDQQRPQSSTEVKQKPQGSAIMHLRERFNAGIEQGTTAQSDANSPRNTARETVNKTVHLDNSSTPNQLCEDSRHQDASTSVQRSIPPVEHSVPQTSEEHEKEASPSSNVTRQGPSLEDSYRNSQEIATSLNVWDENEIAEEQEANNQQHLYFDTQETAETTASLNSWDENEATEEQEVNDQQHLYLQAHETAESTVSYADWDDNEIGEEQEVDHQQFYAGTSYDWFSDIARPRSYWEDRRQEWYQEVLSSSSENEEIRRLLERRTVSSFLTSDFRERMDQLMISRVQRQTDLEGSQEGEQDEEGSQERMGQLMLSYLQQHLNPPASTNQEEEEEQEEERDEGEVVDAEEEEEEDEEEEMQEVEEEEEGADGEEESQISHQYHEASDYFDQSLSSMQMRSQWSYRDREVGDDSDRIESTSPRQPLPSPSYYRDSRQFSSSTSRPSIEMELIYDLRGHMEQLQREMSELRKCMMSCMDLQAKLQQSIQQEAHSGQGERKNSLDRAPRNRSCSICYEMQVDSLLYRCGHMCTCLKCAHELQWSSGKCPICRAPIVDVVRAYMDS